MAEGKTRRRRSRATRPLSAVGGLAAASLKPLREGATEAVLDSAWFETLLADALDSERVQAALKKALETEGAEHVVETLFESGLVDEFVDRLVVDGAIWGLLDGVLASEGAERLIGSPALWGLIDKALQSQAAQQLVDSGALWSLIDKAIESQGAERFINNPSFWSLIDGALESDGAERLVDRLFDSGLADLFVDRLLTSKAVWDLVDEIAASPAVTAAVTQQSLGLADQVGSEMRARSRKADAWLLRAAHRHGKSNEASGSVNGSGPQSGEFDQQAAPVVPATSTDKPATVQPDVRYVGIASRTIAFAVDGVLISSVALIVELGVALIVSVVHPSSTFNSLIVAAGAIAYALWAMTYFVTFWSTTGQTPGARLMQFRVVAVKGERLKPRRSVLRSVGLVLAAIPLFAGYLPVAFARKHRGLQDYLARTIVVDAPQLSIAGQQLVTARSQRALAAIAARSQSDDPTAVPNDQPGERTRPARARPTIQNGEPGRTHQ